MNERGYPLLFIRPQDPCDAHQQDGQDDGDRASHRLVRDLEGGRQHRVLTHLDQAREDLFHHLQLDQISSRSSRGSGASSSSSTRSFRFSLFFRRRRWWIESHIPDQFGDSRFGLLDGVVARHFAGDIGDRAA